MKTKQSNIRAAFTAEVTNAVVPANKQLVTGYKLVDKKSEKVVVDCRTYIGTSRNASTVYACLWVDINGNKKPDGFEYGYVSGYGSAGGYGYCKESAAVQDAIDSAKIELFGTAYRRQSEKVDFKKKARIGGVGMDAVESALLAIANAAGYNDVIMVRVDG